MTGTSSWTDHLRSHVLAARVRDPVPAREALSALEEQQCRVLGGHLIRWLNDWGPQQLQALDALPILGAPKEGRVVVYVTDNAGMVAAREIVDVENDGFLACRRSEVDSFPEFADDHACAFHIELLSYFEPLPAREARSARKKVPKGSGKLWLHRTASIVAENVGQGDDHLWRWDGAQLELIQEAYGMRVY